MVWHDTHSMPSFTSSLTEFFEFPTKVHHVLNGCTDIISLVVWDVQTPRKPIYLF